MLTTPQLRSISERLYVYDVVQGGWEQEPNGFEANVAHVLTHLAKDLSGKDFTDPKTIKESIAPDSVQYGLRLSRWANISVEDIDPKADGDPNLERIASGLGHASLSLAAYSAGMGELASQLHDRGHKSDRVNAILRRSPQMKMASSMLIYSANLYAEQYDFDLEKAFDTRLAGLRVRFRISEPDEQLFPVDRSELA